jgi:hypothetical protein
MTRHDNLQLLKSSRRESLAADHETWIVSAGFPSSSLVLGHIPPIALVSREEVIEDLEVFLTSDFGSIPRVPPV